MFGKDKKNGERHVQLGHTDLLDLHAIRGGYGQPALAVGHERIILDFRARFAMECITRWAMISAVADGEDSSGRARVRRMTPDEITDHACACAEQAFLAFKAKGWLADVPPYADLVDAVKDQENINE